MSSQHHLVQKASAAADPELIHIQKQRGGRVRFLFLFGELHVTFRPQVFVHEITFMHADCRFGLKIFVNVHVVTCVLLLVVLLFMT